MDNENAQKEPILICGMHRSGTSLVTQMLETCGLYLGTTDQLLPVHSTDNPTGYWEYQSAVEFADEILLKMGCSWETPGISIPDTWLMNIDLNEEEQKVIKIFKPLMDSGKIWGWKDPRITLLLPFWKTMFPNLKLVICLRNPLEVAFSLSKRFGATHVDFEKALELWRDYYEILNRTMFGTQYLITHYELFFYDSEKELRRICEFSGLSHTPVLIENAQKLIKSNLYRGVVTEDLLQRFDNMPKGLLKLYEEFSSMAGPVHKTMLADRDYKQVHSRMAFEKLISTSYTVFDQFHHKFQIIEEELLSKTQSCNDLTIQLNKQEQTIQNLNKRLKEQEQSIQSFLTRLEQQEHEILYYALSKSWRLTRPFRKIRKIARNL